MSAAAIPRDPAAAARQRFDLIVVGGGVHGIMVALEAVRRRLRPLLVERADFAAQTSHNSLRILHGGLRHLQRLDLAGALESARERAWWRRHFPELVEPLPCLLPLYGDGLHRPAVLRLALALSRALERWPAPDGAAGGLPRGSVLDPATVSRLAPALAARPGLRGGAVWYDGFAPDAPRLLIELLRWACAYGAVALNYVAAVGLIERAGRVAGIRARDLETAAEYEFQAPLVVNAAGPWAAGFAAACGADLRLPARPVLAWNVAFRRPAPADHALAVRAPRPGAQTYFLVPWRGGLLAGTGYAARSDGAPDEPPAGGLPADLLDGFLAELNAALPGLALARDEALRVFAGLLPGAPGGAAWPADRPVVIAHHAPAGLVSLCGVKLTTARALADRLLRRALPGVPPRPAAEFRRPAGAATPAYPLAWRPAPGDTAWLEPLRAALAEEAVQHLDDLLLRRSSLGDDPLRARELAPQAARLFDWGPARAQAEQARLAAALAPLMAPADAPEPSPAPHASDASRPVAASLVQR